VHGGRIWGKEANTFFAFSMREYADKQKKALNPTRSDPGLEKLVDAFRTSAVLKGEQGQGSNIFALTN
jgi:hypothetical protein